MSTGDDIKKSLQEAISHAKGDDTAVAHVGVTEEEREAIERFKKACEELPDTLWLFNNGTIHVMKTGPYNKVMRKKNGSVDQDYEVAQVKGVLSEGGDW